MVILRLGILAPQNGAQATKVLQLPSHIPLKPFATLSRGFHFKNLHKIGHDNSEIAGHEIFEMTGHTAEIIGHARVKYAFNHSKQRKPRSPAQSLRIEFESVNLSVWIVIGPDQLIMLELGSQQ